MPEKLERNFNLLRREICGVSIRVNCKLLTRRNKLLGVTGTQVEKAGADSGEIERRREKAVGREREDTEGAESSGKGECRG